MTATKKTKTSLRGYQIEAVEAYQASKSRARLICLPAGTGKSWVIAEIIKREWAAGLRYIYVLTHKSTILQQDADIIALHTGMKPKIYCAKLERKDNIKGEGIVCASIQSLIRLSVPKIELMLVDEAHLIALDGNTQYRKLIKLHPEARIAGFTATGYRLGQGLLTEGKGALFDENTYDATSGKKIRNFFDEGYLSPLVSYRGEDIVDTTGVKSNAGDYITTEIAKKARMLKRSIYDEIVSRGKKRNKWLIFCCDINHINHVVFELEQRDIKAVGVHSKADKDMDKAISDFKENNVKALVSCQMLTTGVDIPAVDMIAILRPTRSAGLWVQMLGRGTRTAPKKKDCLILDYTNNTLMLGTFDNVSLPSEPSSKSNKRGQDNSAPSNIICCGKCRAYNTVRSAVCVQCGADLKRYQLSELSIMGSKENEDNFTSRLVKKRVAYARLSLHYKPYMPNSLVLILEFDDKTQASHYFCFDHAKHHKKYKGIVHAAYAQWDKFFSFFKLVSPHHKPSVVSYVLKHFPTKKLNHIFAARIYKKGKYLVIDSLEWI